VSSLNDPSHNPPTGRDVTESQVIKTLANCCQWTTSYRRHFLRQGHKLWTCLGSIYQINVFL